MKKLYAISLAVLGTFAFSSTSNAQTLVKNDGATITIEAGAVLFIEGGLENTNAGTIDNQGTIELEGNFLNSATYSGTADTVRFSGADHSDMTSNGDTIGVLELDKDATKNVNLLDDATVKSKLDFIADDNKVSVGANDLIIQNGGVLSSYDENEFVLTSGAGFLKIEGIANGDTETFPVGATTTTYNPLEVTGGAGLVTDDYSVRAMDSVLADGLTGAPIDEGVANASWELTEGTPAGTDLNVTAEWAGSDELVNFDRTMSAVSLHDGIDWDMELGDLGAASGADPYTRDRTGLDNVGVLAVGSDGSPELTTHAVVAVKVFLQGPYAGGVMGDLIRDSAFIPTIEPYSTLSINPYGYKGFPAADMADGTVFDDHATDNNIVDWVVVEVRDGVMDTVISSIAALIQKDGDVVALDGVGSLEVPGVPVGNYFIAVKHRNHLAVRSASTLALSSVSTAYDFTTDLTQAYDNVAVTTNDAMVDLGGGVFGMYAGDINRNNKTTFIGGANDKSALLAKLGPGNAGGVLNEYSEGDVNMNAKVSYIAASNDKSALLAALGAGNAGGVLESHVSN